MANEMKASCICPTYGRYPHDMFMLEETVYWFLQQDYPNKELIILNDAAEQQLICDAPQVKVVNRSERYPTLGAKYNALLRLATGDVIFPWEDDDISLPHRIRQGIGELQHIYYWKPIGSWFQNGKQTELTYCSDGNVFHNASCYRHGTKFNYTEVSGPQDAIADMVLRQGSYKAEKLSPINYPYIYRWGHSSSFGNLSGYGNPEFAYASRATPIPATVRIEPRMHRNYLVEVEQCLQRSLPLA